MPGAGITHMGGTGELSDSLDAANDDGISTNPMSCGGGPLALMQRNQIASPTNPVPAPTNPMALMPSGTTMGTSVP
jgi:hypothetical protein